MAKVKTQLINGKEGSIVATFHDDATNKDLIIYTYDSEVTYGYYKIVNGNIEVTPIDNEEDKQKIYSMISMLSNSLKEV